MDLKAVYDSMEDVPELYRDIFAEKDGKAVLNVQGVKTQHDFDKINEGILKEREEHKRTKERYRPIMDLGIDPSDVVEKVSRFGELEEIANSKMDPSRISELADERVAKTKSQYEKQLAEAQQAISQFQEREKRRKIHDAARAALTDAKVLPSAQEDALLWAERIFDVGDDGNVYTRDAVGVTPGIGPEAWLKEVEAKRPHWWGDNAGLGANGSGKGAGSVARTNPWKDETKNLTEQMRITRENPELAAQLKKMAGVA